MTTVFVHGVPETTRVWSQLQGRLGITSEAVALPGFASPLPAGFSPSKDAYASWLTDELRRFKEPVDLVGHDWGALLTLRVASAGGVPLRSWAADVASVFDPDYSWHPWAASLLPAGQGELVLAAMRDSAPDDPAGAVQFMQTFGVPREPAREMAAAHDEVMSRCILGLYRSSVPNVRADWTVPTGGASAPGLILIAGDDPVEDEARARGVADSLGARAEVLDGAGHWWMFGNDDVGKVLSDFWDSVPRT